MLSICQISLKTGTCRSLNKTSKKLHGSEENEIIVLITENKWQDNQHSSRQTKVALHLPGRTVEHHTDPERSAMHPENVSSETGDCQEPSLDALQRTWLEHYNENIHQRNLTTSHFLLPDHRESIQNDLERKGNRSTVSKTVEEDTACDHSRRQFGTSDPVQTRSLCPWHHVMNSDPDRYPEHLVQAQCSCESCRHVGADHATCQEVRYAVPVLRRSGTCRENLYQWEHGWELLAVACVCAAVPM